MRGVRGLRFVCIVALGCIALAGPSTASAATAWCGNDSLSTDRPDTVGGRKWHVIYAIPSDGADRFAATAPRIVTDLGAIVAWWLREDATRAPRFDLSAFPGCGTAIGNLDLSFVRLPQPASAYATAAVRLGALARDLAGAFHESSKKYVVYYDGPVADERICGSAVGVQTPNVGGAFAVAGIYMQYRPDLSGCGAVGDEGYAAATTAHEMLHMIGVAPQGAPHACAGDTGHICDGDTDLMAPSGNSPYLRDYALDVGRDDYYGHAGSWWDAQDSPWLANTTMPDRRLSVEIVGGTGGESVSAATGGIECPSACSLAWAGGDSVSLAAEAGYRSRFLRWEGACTGDAGCTVTMDGDKGIRAVFGRASALLRIAVVGRGTVASAATGACRGSCRREVTADARVQLRASAARGWRFAGWNGACAASKLRPGCTVTMSAARTVGARFVRKR